MKINEHETTHMSSTTQIAPSLWASYLINGDASGINAEDKAAADQFIAKLGLGAPHSCSDFGYSRFLRCDCQVYEFYPSPADSDPVDRARAFFRSLQPDVLAGTRGQTDAEESAIRKLTAIGWSYESARHAILNPDEK